MPNKYICIHGHFYQPPRENAWLEEIEVQDSASPFHDWNERITYECYGPNASSRILNEEHKIIDIINNYSKMSFNFGPTLLYWMQNKAPKVYEGILIADKLSMKQQNGHGNAMAQVYNHIIMPLANRRDKETQVQWAIADFEKRFERKPEGMWLAETAVDNETLEVLASYDIKFTVLAPRQAKKIKWKDANHWSTVDEHSLDTKRPYLCKLNSGKSIAIFFYNGTVSQELAFNSLLDDGKKFSDRLLEQFDNGNSSSQLVHIATDGESYGHHHKHGDMALAFCLDKIESLDYVELINYGNYLEKFPPQDEVEVHSKSSWSCVHGVERWRADCGCNSGGKPGWNQQWRAPLKAALDWLRDSIGRIYFKEMKLFCNDPWELRNHYIDIINDRSEKNINIFIKKHSLDIKNDDDLTKCMRLLEMQRQSLLMYTSCAWFFDEVSGIETEQVLQYANRAIQLAESESHSKLAEKFEILLAKVPSNVTTYGNALQVYIKNVIPHRLSLSMVGMHYAVNSIFAENPDDLETLNYIAKSEYFEKLEQGGELKLVVGKYNITSRITRSQKNFSFAALYLGQHHIIGASSDKLSAFTLLRMYQEMKTQFDDSNINGIFQLMQTYFGEERFSFWNLFRDEQRKVLHQITNKDIEETENTNQKLFERNYTTISALDKAGIPLPQSIRKNMELVLNAEIRRYFENGTLKPSRLKQYAEEVKRWEIQVDDIFIPRAVENRLSKEMENFSDTLSYDHLYKIERTIKHIQAIKLTLNLREMQTEYYKIGKQHIAVWKEAMDQGNEEIKVFMDTYLKLGSRLNVIM
jgi:alpha-amylase/alpha-mannosidase (GH57 family)